MNQATVPTLFAAFNARTLRPSEVAKTFVPPPQFRDLCKRRHTQIIGPRGSGKTTLLKMLQMPALEAWKHKDADALRESIDFVGVFVAADRSWGSQLEALGFGKLPRESHEVFARAAFTTHVLRAIVIAMLQQVSTEDPPVGRAFGRVAASPQQEADLVKRLMDPWHIRPAIPSLLALKHALTSRLGRIHELANGLASGNGPGRLPPAPEAFLNIHFLQAASIAAELFDDLVRQEETKWALLFDELELAPDWIRQELVGSLRSTDERFLFKLALSPYTHDPTPPASGAGGSAPGQDYDDIVLWYAEKRDGYPFCEALWKSIVQARALPPVSPRDVLGASYFETASARTAKVPYSR